MKILVAWVLSLAGAAGAAAETLAVAVTIVPQAWLVEQIGGDSVSVMAVVEPGESPATYFPSDAQVSRLNRSAVYFRIGVASENGPWLDALRRAGRVEIVDLRQGVEMHDMSGHDMSGHDMSGHDMSPHRHDAPVDLTGKDPHIWLSPSRLKRQARTVAETLVRIDPDSGAGYRRRLSSLEQRLDRLEVDMRRHLAPFAGRPFLAFHPAWGYLAADFRLRQLTLELEGKEPSEAEVTELQAFAREHGVRVVFVQPQITGRAAGALAAAIGGRTEVLDPLAADVVSNLRFAAERLADSFGVAASPGGEPVRDDEGGGVSAPAFFQDMATNPFLLTGLWAGLLASLACGMIGPYVVTRRIVFLGGALAHIAVGGLGATIFLRHAAPGAFGWLQPLHGAAVVAVLAALMLARLEPGSAKRTVAADTLIGALWAVGMAAGILLIKFTPGYHTELMSYLFGNLAYVGMAEVRMIFGLDVVIVVTVLLFQKRFLALCLDPEQARLQGVSVRRTSAVLLVLVALTVITLTHVVGLILVIALLSLPAATSGLLVRRLPQMILLSVALAAVLTTGPRIAVYGTRISPEPAIVLSAAGLFLLAAGWRARRTGRKAG